jgi:hypothetical protein
MTTSPFEHRQDAKWGSGLPREVEEGSKSPWGKVLLKPEAQPPTSSVLWFTERF